MISHDPNTRRCFGLDYDVTTTNYKGVLDKLYTGKGSIPIDIKEALAISREDGNELYKMPTLKDVAELFANDERYKNVRLMIDIKVTNEPWIISKIIKVLKEANSDIKGFWAPRTVFGIWRLDVLESAMKNTTDIPLAHIGISRSLAKQFIEKGGNRLQAISLNRYALISIGSHDIMDLARSRGILIYMWTVNEVSEMKWSIASNLAGVITDHPDVYGQLRSDANTLTEKESEEGDSETSLLIKSSLRDPMKYISWFEWYIKNPALYLMGVTFFALLLRKSQNPKNKRAEI